MRRFSLSNGDFSSFSGWSVKRLQLLDVKRKSIIRIVFFQDITGYNDIEECRAVLERHNWDIEVIYFWFPYYKLKIYLRLICYCQILVEFRISI